MRQFVNFKRITSAGDPNTLIFWKSVIVLIKYLFIPQKTRKAAQNERLQDCNFPNGHTQQIQASKMRQRSHIVTEKRESARSFPPSLRFLSRRAGKDQEPRYPTYLFLLTFLPKGSQFLYDQYPKISSSTSIASKEMRVAFVFESKNPT